MPDPVEIFPWTHNFECGIPEIDQQHKRLVELLNILVSHLAYQSEAPTLNQIFAELRDYAVMHFSTEERLWQNFLPGDAWVEGHKAAHSDFVETIIALKNDQSGRPVDLVIETIVTFLTHWLAQHIIESDKRMAKAVLAISSGLPVDVAKDQANAAMSGATRLLIDTVMGMYDILAHRTMELTRQIGKRIKAETALRAAQADVVRLKDRALEEREQIRKSYEDALARNQEQNFRMRAAMEQTIGALSSTLGTRDPYTAEHQNNVAEIAVAIAEEMKLDAFCIEGLKLAALVHDIGKIKIPLQILCKPTRLTRLEIDFVRLHPQAAWDILKDLHLPWPLADIVRQHHEYLDGSGYPDGLRGGAILLESRILTVADIVESMTSARPYRPALGLEAAIEEIRRLQGTKLDADVVEACLRCFGWARG